MNWVNFHNGLATIDIIMVLLIIIIIIIRLHCKHAVHRYICTQCIDMAYYYRCCTQCVFVIGIRMCCAKTVKPFEISLQGLTYVVPRNNVLDCLKIRRIHLQPLGVTSL